MRCTVRGGSFSAVVAAPVGNLGIRIVDDSLAGLQIFPPGAEERLPTHPVAAQAVGQLSQYFVDSRSPFDLPLALRGTPFQRRVWESLLKTSSGELVTYGELAHRLGTSARAVGGACAANPIPIIIPCHRVVGTAGLVGYKSRSDQKALGTKQWLIAHEQR